MRADIRMPYKLMPKYPGIRPRDEVIWDAFIMSHPDAFDYVYYNVHLGVPTIQLDEVPELRKNGFYEVSQWCVDVLAFAQDRAYVIEVKPDAGASALGQALSYTKLLESESRILQGSHPVVLTDHISPITNDAARLLGIMIWTP